jgi:hypothetical protein
MRSKAPFKLIAQFLAIVILVLFLVPLCSFGQGLKKYTISGYIREEGSGETLIGVNIYVPEYKTGTTTNNYGFYSITLPESDSLLIIFSYVGFTPQRATIGFHDNTDLNISLRNNNVLSEVTITGQRSELPSQSPGMSNIKINTAQVKNVPSLLGEKDVLKVIQLMPGVQKGSEGMSGFYVRGGGPDQNLIILDDAIVYNVSHLFGFFSVFNGDALKSVELTKGGFPARFGGRLSSVLEMTMKEGNKEEWHGNGGIGLISSRVTIEGPLKKGKSSVLISGRRTYADLFLRPLLKSLKVENTGYYFYDLNAKINYDFGRNNKLYLSGYFGKDKYYYKNKNSFHNEDLGFLWGNATGTLRWNHLFSSKIFGNTSAIFSNYNFDIYEEDWDKKNDIKYTAEFYSGIQDFSLKYDLDIIPAVNHWIKAGVLSTFHRFTPQAFVKTHTMRNINLKDNEVINGIESGVYAEDTWKPFQRLKINDGIRFSHFVSSGRQYHFFEPRLSAAWMVKNGLAAKASFSSMNQFVHLISGTGISLPTDLWVPTTARIRPQHSDQLALGFAKDIFRPALSISIEGYMKKMNNVLAYKQGATFLDLDSPDSGIGIKWENNVTSGKSWSSGIEFLLEKKEGKLTGWIGYTLSKTMMQFDSLNYGRKFPAKYDRRHDISIAATYKLNNRITISGTWVYGTGNSVTIPESLYLAPIHMKNMSPYFVRNQNYSDPVYDYGEMNNFRVKAYHRLDLGISFHKQKRWGQRIWDFSVYNVYNRKNPYYYYPETRSENEKTYGILRQVSLFTIIPSFTYSFEF